MDCCLWAPLARTSTAQTPSQCGIDPLRPPRLLGTAIAIAVLADLQGSQKRLAPNFDRRIRRAKERVSFHVDVLIVSGFLDMRLPQRLSPFSPQDPRPDRGCFLGEVLWVLDRWVVEALKPVKRVIRLRYAQPVPAGLRLPATIGRVATEAGVEA
jgi:hypothetical protein